MTYDLQKNYDTVLESAVSFQERIRQHWEDKDFSGAAICLQILNHENDYLRYLNAQLVERRKVSPGPK